MTYRGLLYKAQRLINRNEITLGEYDEMTKPLDEEVRKVGKWIYDKKSQNWRCSVCNETPKTLGYVGTSDFMAEHFRFCNHCGTEMRGAEMDITRADRIYCLKVSSDYHSEVCEECKHYPNCDHITQDDMTEVTIKDLQKLEQIARIVNAWNNDASTSFSDMCKINGILKGVKLWQSIES